jgi:predicted ester cyclase
MPDMQMIGKQFIAKDDKLIVQFTMTGTHQGDLFGVTGTGKPVEINGINIYRLAEGKIIETWQMADYWGLLHAVGKA